MVNKSESLRITKFESIYDDKTLAGVNELYHIFLRDSVIPACGGRSALELGCGKGLWTKILCERYDSVDVVDGSSDLLRKVINHNVNCKAKLTGHLALVEDFNPDNEKKWEHIYITFLLEHVLDPVSILKKVRNYLDKDGSIFLAVPNANSVHRIIAVRMGLIRDSTELSDNDKNVGHRRVYTLELLRNQIEGTGLRVKKEGFVGFKPLTLKQMANLTQEVVWAFCSAGDLAGENAAYLTMEVTHP